MHRTVFAGLTAPDENDDITVDGGSFLTVNPDVTDRLLQIGCVTHRHDGHAGLPEPVAQLSAAVSTTGGQIEAGVTIYMGYTLVDAQGGETQLGPVVSTNTQGQIFPDTPPPTASASYSAGSLPIGGYSYAFVYSDGAGGQTELQPAVFVTRDAGPASGQIILSGISAGLVSGLVSWDAWRADEGSDYNLLKTGETGDTFTDTGFSCTDCSATPPTSNTTNHTSELQVQLPTEEQEPGLAGAAGLNLYLSSDGSFSNPSLYNGYPVASAGQIVDIPELLLSKGFPPPVNRSIQGASKIDPDSEISGPWKKAVANFAGLPANGNQDGDVRETLGDHAIYVWNAEGKAWEVHTGGGGGSGHVIQNPSGANMPAEALLQFAGSGVTVVDDAAHGRTVVTFQASGSSITYRHAWSPTTIYHVDDVVTRAGGSFIAISETEGSDPSTDEGVHWGVLATPGAAGSGGVEGLHWRGAWSNVSTYAESDGVSYAGASYISLSNENTGNNPQTSGEWGIIAEAGRGLNPRGPWLVGSTYAEQDLVERAGNSYVSKTNGNVGNDPTLDAEEVSWSLFVERGATGAGEVGPAGMLWRGPYSSTTTYKLRDGVQREGSSYISIAEGNKGHDPVSDGEVHWQLVAKQGSPGKEGKAGAKGAGGMRFRGEWSAATTYEVNDVVRKEGIYYIAQAKGANHEPPNATWWEVFSGGGPKESKVWAVSEPEAGILPGFTIRIDEFSEAGQLIIGFDLRVGEGEATVTVRKNGVAITHLSAVKEGTYVDMTALKETGEAGKFFPVKLLDGDYIDFDITAASSPSADMSATLHMRHLTWGD